MNFDEIDELALLDSGSEQEAIDTAQSIIKRLQDNQKSFSSNNEVFQKIIKNNPTIEQCFNDLNSLFIIENSVRFSPVMLRNVFNFLKLFFNEITQKSTDGMFDETEVSGFRILNNDLTDKNTELSSKIEELNKTITDLESKQHCMGIDDQAKINSLIMEVEKKEKQILELNDQLALNNTHISRLQNTVNSRNVESAQSQQFLSDLKIKTDKKESRIQNMELQLHEQSLKLHDTELQNQKLLSMVNEYREKINQLNQKLANASSNKLNDTVTKLTESIISITEQYNECLEKSKEKSDVIEKLRRIIDLQNNAIDSYDVSLKSHISESSIMNSSALLESKILTDDRNRELLKKIKAVVNNDDILEGIAQIRADCADKMEKLRQQNVRLSNICIALVKFKKIDSEFDNTEIPKEYMSEILRAEKVINENGAENELVGTVQEEINKVMQDTDKYLETICSFAIYTDVINKMNGKYDQLKECYDKVMEIALKISEMFKLPFNPKLPTVIQAKFEKLRYFYQNLQATTGSYDSDAVVAYVHNAKQFLDEMSESVFPAFKYNGPMEEFPFYALEYAKSHSINYEEELKGCKEVIAHLRKRLDEQRSENKKLTETLKQKSDDVKSLQKESKSNRSKLEHLIKENNSLEAKAKTFEGDNYELLATAEEIKRKLEECQKEKEDIAIKFKQTSEDNARLIEDHRNELERLSKNYADNLNDVKEHHEEQLDSIIKQNLDKESELQEEIKNLKKSYSLYKKKMNGIVRKYESSMIQTREISLVMDQPNSSRQDSIQGENNEVAHLKNIIKALETEKVDLVSSNKEKDIKISEIAKSRDSYWSLKLQSVQEKFEDQVSVLTVENKDLNEVLKTLSARMFSMIEIDSDPLSQINILEDKLDSLKRIKDCRDVLEIWQSWSKKYDKTGKDSHDKIMTLIDTEMGRIPKLSRDVANLRQQKLLLINIATADGKVTIRDKSIRPILVALVGIARIKRTIRK